MASVNSTVVDLPIDDTFDIVCDPHTYPRWLVGAQEIESVDADWPAVGSSFRHRIGIGPARLPGSTTVRAAEVPHLLELAAGMGPLGEARVRFRLQSNDDGTTEVEIEEAPSGGLARLGWFVYRPVIFGLLWGRNQLSLNALADLASERVTA